ncbi:MAG: YciI family protein [Pirellulales bacterium]
MKFVCLGYLDEAAWNAIPESERQSFMQNCFAYDEELRRNGHWVGGEGLYPAAETVTLKIRNGSAMAIDGPFVETKEHIGGILIIDARDMAHAVALMSKHPGVKAGPFEIRRAYDDVKSLLDTTK